MGLQLIKDSGVVPIFGILSVLAIGIAMLEQFEL